MATRPNSMETTLLSIELLRRIPRQKKITASELRDALAAAGFDRDIRSVQRQIDTLCKHFEIERDDRTKPFGYRWKSRSPGFAVPSMSTSEALLLALAQQHLKNLLPANVTRALDENLRLAWQTLDNQHGATLAREWLTKVRVVGNGPPLLPPKVSEAVLADVSEALYANRWLDIEYQNAGGKRSEAQVMPLGLAQQDVRLYLVCRFAGYENERSLALHRIRSTRVGSTFIKPVGFSLANYEDQGRFAVGDGQRVVLKFEIRQQAGRHLQETPMSIDQQITVHGDWLRVQATVIDSRALQSWLNSFGRDVRKLNRAPRL